MGPGRRDSAPKASSGHQTMTEETNVIHAIAAVAAAARLAESRLDPAIARRSAAAARPARCAGDLAKVAERLLAQRHAGTNLAVPIPEGAHQG